MDPISVAASILTLIAAASQTTKGLRSLYNLRHAPQEIIELTNEVSELQALLCLIQKATKDISSSVLSSQDRELFKRLIESGKEPLDQLNELITLCSRDVDTNSDNIGTRSSVSFTAWLKARNSVGKIREKFQRAHRNIGTALAALNNIHRRDDNRVILDIHDLVLNQVRETEARTSSESNELALYRQFSRAVIENINATTSGHKLSLGSRQDFSSHPSDYGQPNRSFAANSGETKWQTSAKHIQLCTDQSTAEPSASIRASISKGTCDWSCRCQCHPRKGVESPRWLTDLLGTLFYSHTGTPFLRLRPCNYPSCIQRESASCQLTYHFPRWMMKKAFMLTASYRDLGGVSASWSIGFPCTISASHIAWQCIEQSHSHIVLRLLREGSIFSNDMADDDGTPLLIFALKYRRHDVVGILLDYGANPHLVDPRGISACAYAQSSLLTSRPSQRPSWLTQMDLTLDEPSVTDDLCFTPLHHVVIGLEQADLRQQLRLNSIYINTLDSIGRSPLHWASIMGNSAAVSVLLEHGASPTTKDKEQMTPLHDIFLAPSLTQKQCAQLLLDSGAEVNALDFWERTALRIAVSYQSISLDFLEMLIDKGADVNCRDMYQQSPLLKSIQGSREATQLLLSHGADTELPDIYGNTPVLEAIYRENPERLQLLLEHGANINRDFQLKPGRRARDGLVHLLDFVVWYGNVEIMRIIEESIVYPFQLSHPVDNLEQFQNFRLANGRKAGGEEQDAIARILSKIVVANAPGSYFSSRGVDSDDEKDDCNNEIFVDAQEHFPEGGCAV